MLYYYINKKYINTLNNKHIYITNLNTNVMRSVVNLYVQGFDRQGKSNQISNIVSNEYGINMRSINLDAHDVKGIYTFIFTILTSQFINFKPISI